MAGPPPAGAPGNAAGVVPRVMSRAELVRLWEDLIDQDPEAAEELFFDALLRDARAEYGRRTRKVEEGKDGDEEERRRARVFRPWEPPAPGGSAMPPPPQPVAAPPPVKRAVVLGLRAPPHLARKQERTPSEPNKPRAV
ncbi:hypothetical protein SETIT_9G379100v2 [Setaria italica]|uniref:Uncharacterized protein n=1 Tax=Setaria italica TaxID=4555 RepID=A0A368SPZ8_SETIT|nr:hypothetical protein SETIT_9G379100v2 [Setaria italica]